MKQPPWAPSQSLLSHQRDGCKHALIMGDYGAVALITRADYAKMPAFLAVR